MLAAPQEDWGVAKTGAVSSSTSIAVQASQHHECEHEYSSGIVSIYEQDWTMVELNLAGRKRRLDCKHPATLKAARTDTTSCSASQWTAIDGIHQYGIFSGRPPELDIDEDAAM